MENAGKVGGSSSKEADECTLDRCSAANAYHMDGSICSMVKGDRASHSGRGHVVEQQKFGWGLFERFYVLKRHVVAEIKLIENYVVERVALSTGVCFRLCPMTKQIMLQDTSQDCLTSLDIYVLVHKNKRLVLLTSKFSVRLGERICRSPPKDVMYQNSSSRSDSIEDSLFKSFLCVWSVC